LTFERGLISIFSAAAAKPAFIFYVSVYGLSNLIGHYLMVFSFFMMYKAIVETGISNPSEILFRELGQRETELKNIELELRKAKNELEERVVKRTRELLNANIQLELEISERQHVENELRESEERFRNTFEQATVGIAHVALDGRWLRFNPTVCRVLGYSSEELLKSCFQDITHPDDLEADLNNMRSVLSGDIDHYSMEKRYFRKDGALIWAMLTVSLVKNADGEPKYFISIIQDIDERKKTDSLLKQRHRQLEEINRQLDDFAYIISHDLREPLRGIYNFSAVLLEDYKDKLESEGISMLETLMRLAKRQEEQIRAILHYSRIGRMNLSVERISLDAVVNEVLDSLKTLLDENRVSVHKPARLPDAVCDRVQMSEVFQNLIVNAVQYNNRQNRQIEIGFNGAEPETVSVPDIPEACCKKSCVFYVRDNGIGIEERHLESVFKIFTRLHGREDFGGGTGVGLTISKKIIERHGGRIWAESVSGQGATFYFTLRC
jgi:PAS domain S-box-containing protein